MLRSDQICRAIGRRGSVDSESHCHTRSPGKRRRWTLNPFLQVSPGPNYEETPPRRDNPIDPEAKRFKGVRFRPDRRTWVAEMKPPKGKNKVSFDDFKCQTQAARAIDAAFHHYGKSHLLNFADTPRILSTKPTPTGLNEHDKLKLVKEQAKWLASIASTLPSAPASSAIARNVPASPPLETPEPSRGCTAAITALGFRSSSEITSPLGSGGTDEADDGVCQPQFLRSIPMELPVAGSYVANGVGSTEPSKFAAADHVNEFGEPGRRVFRTTTAENVIVGDPECSSGAQRRDFVNSHGFEQPRDEFQRILRMDFLRMSPPPPNMFQTESPRGFEGDSTDRQLELQSLRCE